MPMIHNILESLDGATWFSTFDLKSGFWQVEMAYDSRQKTAFVTTAGLFQFKTMPFGTRNSSATFQRLMQTVWREIVGKSCFVYIDDIIIYSKIKEHLVDLRTVMEKLSKAGLSLNMKKCHLFQRKLKFLGHIVSDNGEEVDPGKTQTKSEYPVPGDIMSLQRFLVLVGWYQKFIPHFVDVAEPFNRMKWKGMRWNLMQECQDSFEQTAVSA